MRDERNEVASATAIIFAVHRCSPHQSFTFTQIVAARWMVPASPLTMRPEKG